MNFLYLIPARGGSKGVPFKNIKELAGKPLIYYSLAAARALTEESNICVSTDDVKIKLVVENYPQHVPFLRPEYLATDTAGTYEVLLHAIGYYEALGRYFDAIVLLQPTSPLRRVEDIQCAINDFTLNLDMVVSVKKSHAAGVICSENSDGFLEMTLNKASSRRQDLGTYYEYNGAIYVMNVASLKNMKISEFTKVKKYVMDDEFSIDIDTIHDFKIAELMIDVLKR